MFTSVILKNKRDFVVYNKIAKNCFTECRVSLKTFVYLFRRPAQIPQQLNIV